MNCLPIHQRHRTVRKSATWKRDQSTLLVRNKPAKSNYQNSSKVWPLSLIYNLCVWQRTRSGWASAEYRQGAGGRCWGMFKSLENIKHFIFLFKTRLSGFVCNLPRWLRWTRKEIFKKKKRISQLVYCKSMQDEPRGINIFTWQLLNRTDVLQELQMCHNFPTFNHQSSWPNHLDSSSLHISSSAKFENAAARLKWLTMWCRRPLSSLGWWRDIIRVVRWLG